MIEPTRHFLSVDGRRVHLWKTGEGPPALLIHSSPANARLLAPEMAYLAGCFTLYAFDTPGFGLSDPLPLAEMTIADLADATARAMAEVGLPPCPVYGTHTGAAVALELAVRHPARVTGLVLDGLPMFTPDEVSRNFGEYFRQMPVTDLGGVYAEAWTRFRDQAVWFPWSVRRAANLNDYDLSPPESTHRWVSMYFEAAAHYTPAYRAALEYGPRAAQAVRELDRPCLFTATDTDMLFPHMERLPPLRDGQMVRRIGRSSDAKFALIAEGFTIFGAAGPAPQIDPFPLASCKVERQYFMAREKQIHVRHCGDPAVRRCFLILHDAPGCSAWVEPQIASLGQGGFALAPDLPGHGDSAARGPMTLDDAAQTIEALVGALVPDRLTVIGMGHGSALAARIAARGAVRVERLVLCGAPLPDEDERADLLQSYVPRIAIVEDGGHWYRTWLMLRDAQVWWPWYRRKRETQRGCDLALSAAQLHTRVRDVMGQRETYGDLARAALLENSLLSDLAACAVQVLLVRDAPVPLSVHDDRLAMALPQAEVCEWDGWLEAVVRVQGASD